MKKSLLLLAVVLGHTGCAPPGTDTLPEAVRAVATRAASSTPDRLLVVDGTFGDTAMSFATRQALVTAGVVVEDRPRRCRQRDRSPRVRVRNRGCGRMATPDGSQRRRDFLRDRCARSRGARRVAGHLRRCAVRGDGLDGVVSRTATQAVPQQRDPPPPAGRASRCRSRRHRTERGESLRRAWPAGDRRR